MKTHASAAPRGLGVTLALILAIGSLASPPAPARAGDLLPQSSAPLLTPGEAAPEDRLAIKRLLSLYAHLYDEFETPTWAELFVENATFEIAYRTGGPGSRSLWQGRTEILSNLAPRRAHFRSEGVGRRHYLANPLIYELDRNSARVSAYLLLTSIQPSGQVQLAGSGRYDGRLIKTEAGWRIQAWRFTPDGDPVDFAKDLSAADSPPENSD